MIFYSELGINQIWYQEASKGIVYKLNRSDTTILLSLPIDTVVSDAVNAMKEKGVSSVLLTSGHYSSSQAIPYEAEQTSMTKPTPLPALIEGIVTELDILYRVIADKKEIVENLENSQKLVQEPFPLKENYQLRFPVQYV